MSKELGAGAKWQELMHLVNSRGARADKRRNLLTDRKPHLLGDKCPGSKQRKVGKD